ncbi:unnamed protein product [Bursaphelenchus okinawaensis]|uniref:Uncharacterized protein n=1 Tax=Bursaphelenchus okinawaensis TaxID=465554 RepID=A0A811LJR9_9BILA|nr:unnamed protein product [Bursaphelenchus okinawaensis]CAG9123748.1 unnamed protein product [Bursaphelenchus okinawaensis]
MRKTIKPVARSSSSDERDSPTVFVKVRKSKPATTSRLRALKQKSRQKKAKAVKETKNPSKKTSNPPVTPRSDDTKKSTEKTNQTEEKDSSRPSKTSGTIKAQAKKASAEKTKKPKGKEVEARARSRNSTAGNRKGSAEKKKKEKSVGKQDRKAVQASTNLRPTQFDKAEEVTAKDDVAENTVETINIGRDGQVALSKNEAKNEMYHIQNHVNEPTETKEEPARKLESSQMAENPTSSSCSCTSSDEVTLDSRNW